MRGLYSKGWYLASLNCNQATWTATRTLKVLYQARPLPGRRRRLACSRTLRPMILAIALPQLPLPTMATRSFGASAATVFAAEPDEVSRDPMSLGGSMSASTRLSKLVTYPIDDCSGAHAEGVYRHASNASEHDGGCAPMGSVMRRNMVRERCHHPRREVRVKGTRNGSGFKGSENDQGSSTKRRVIIVLLFLNPTICSSSVLQSVPLRMIKRCGGRV